MGFSTFINNNYCIVYRSHFLIRILHVVYWSGWICKSIVFSLSVKVTLLCVNFSWIIIFSFCSGIGTQGQVSDDRWVVRYGITYSANGLKWTNYTEDNRQKVSSNYFSSACLFMCWSKTLCNFVDWYKWSCSRIALTTTEILGNGKILSKFCKTKISAIASLSRRCGCNWFIKDIRIFSLLQVFLCATELKGWTKLRL